MPGGLEFLRARFAAWAEADALIVGDDRCTYGRLLDKIDLRLAAMDAARLPAGAVVILNGDFTVPGVAALLALIDHGAVAAPVTPSASARLSSFASVADAEWLVDTDHTETGADPMEPLRRLAGTGDHPLYARLRAEGHPGLVLFSSGTTGDPKGVVHDVHRLLLKFQEPRHDLRTIAFLHFDHIGGIDTLFYCLSNGSTVVVPEDRSPDAVCAAVEKHRVQVLPAAPSFLNLLLLSGAATRYDLTSLQVVTYGAELMPESLLARCMEALPWVRFLQRYGTTEIGTPRSSSPDPGSLWMRLGGDGVETRVVDGMLEIHTESTMLGYLNAPSPFTEDGWFRTGDTVEVDGDYIRVLGRATDIISVGGEKVHPGEVEDVIRRLPNVADVSVFGESHVLLGQIVSARVQLITDEDAKSVTERVRSACRERLERYKVPVRVTATTAPLTTARLKADRRPGSA